MSPSYLQHNERGNRAKLEREFHIVAQWEGSEKVYEVIEVIFFSSYHHEFLDELHLAEAEL